MADTKISALTGASTLDGTEIYAAAQGGASVGVTGAQIQTMVGKVLSGSSLAVPGMMVIAQQATYTLTSTTSAQKLFNGGSGGAGTLTLPGAGAYFFDGLFMLSSMSATSGNAKFDILGAGSATINVAAYYGVGIDATAPTTAVAQTGSFATAVGSSASIVLAAAGTGMGVSLRGMFNCTTTGTIIPSVSLVTAAAAVLAAGSFLRVWQWGGNGATYVGPWS